MSKFSVILPLNMESELKLKLKNRTDTHLLRKFWHMLGVGVILVLYHNLQRQEAVMAACLAALLVISLDILRQKSGVLNSTLMKLFGPFMRDYEHQQMSGMSYLLFGVFLIVLIFPPKVVFLSLMFLGIADPVASFVGLRFGKDKLFGHKSLQGSAAAFVVCVLISYIYFASKGIMLERLVLVSLIAGLIGAISELVPVGKIDDNLSFPVLSATFLYALFVVFGGF